MPSPIGGENQFVADNFDKKNKNNGNGNWRRKEKPGQIKTIFGKMDDLWVFQEKDRSRRNTKP